ncbi:MAG TPA: DUF6498-containing protein [Chitinophagaceae bacterium]|nr:DUF6498-containing protein [Chitinophagaceae bacterium]
MKRILSNPSILFLIAGNLYCIWYYKKYPEDFATIVWIYWFQSIIIGFFNFLELLTAKNTIGNITTVNKSPKEFSKGCSAFFFLFHYGIFHLVYFIFLLVDFNSSSVQKLVLLLGIATFFLESLIGFIRHKSIEKTQQVNVGLLFFLPYVRIIPMHLMILLPKFFGITPTLLFLVLKMGADLLTFRIYNFIYKKRSENQSTY